MICCFYCAGAHCMDILPATIGDPDWVVLQRNIEIEIINGWILKYYQDLLENSSQMIFLHWWYFFIVKNKSLLQSPSFQLFSLLNAFHFEIEMWNFIISTKYLDVQKQDSVFFFQSRLSFLFPVAISVSLHYSSNKGRRKKKQKENREATYSATFS